MMWQVFTITHSCVHGASVLKTSAPMKVNHYETVQAVLVIKLSSWSYIM